MRNFFKYYLIGFIVCAFRVDVEIKDLKVFVWKFFFIFIYSNIIGICTALSGMFGHDLYLYFKTKLKK